jgi:hypothetical protein
MSTTPALVGSSSTGFSQSQAQLLLLHAIPAFIHTYNQVL